MVVVSGGQLGQGAFIIMIPYMDALEMPQNTGVVKCMMNKSLIELEFDLVPNKHHQQAFYSILNVAD